eukprot:397347-Rhodomonas_salina.2
MKHAGRADPEVVVVEEADEAVVHLVLQVRVEPRAQEDHVRLEPVQRRQQPPLDRFPELGGPVLGAQRDVEDVVFGARRCRLRAGSARALASSARVERAGTRRAVSVLGPHLLGHSAASLRNRAVEGQREDTECEKRWEDGE